jgi:hypothetical protein
VALHRKSKCKHTPFLWTVWTRHVLEECFLLECSRFTIFTRLCFHISPRDSPRGVHMRPAWGGSWWARSHGVTFCGHHLVCSADPCHIHHKCFVFQFRITV